MARRAFISFDYDNDNDNDNDARLKDLLVGQAKNSHTPFVIADWSIKEPSADWKDKARRQIRASGLVIVLCGKNMSTANSQPELCSGPSRRAFWELALRLLWLSGLPQTERKSAVDAMLTLSLANLPSTSAHPALYFEGRTSQAAETDLHALLRRQQVNQPEGMPRRYCLASALLS